MAFVHFDPLVGSGLAQRPHQELMAHDDNLVDAPYLGAPGSRTCIVLAAGTRPISRFVLRPPVEASLRLLDAILPLLRSLSPVAQLVGKRLGTIA
jgi:hypothetical protein